MSSRSRMATVLFVLGGDFKPICPVLQLSKSHKQSQFDIFGTFLLACHCLIQFILDIFVRRREWSFIHLIYSYLDFFFHFSKFGKTFSELQIVELDSKLPLWWNEFDFGFICSKPWTAPRTAFRALPKAQLKFWM